MQIIAIIAVGAWSFVWNFTLFGILHYVDRNRGKDAFFFVRGQTNLGLTGGGAEVQMEEDRQKAPTMSAFSDPLADMDNDDIEMRRPSDVADVAHVKEDNSNYNSTVGFFDPLAEEEMEEKDEEVRHAVDI